MSKMNPTEFNICQHVVNAMITSKRYANCNYLFLDPVDLTHFPTYTSIVAKPMDLGTVASNLKNGVYKKMEECMSDMTTCFENAELFHKDKPENSWIINFALKMKKNMRKEVRAATKKYGIGSASASSGAGSSSAVTSSASVSTAPTPTNGDGTSSSSSKSSKTKKLNLSIKGGAGRSSNKSPDSSGNATPSEKKKKKKILLTSSSKQSTSATSTTSTNNPTTDDNAGPSTTSAAKPKLSIKLNAKGSSAPISSSSSSSPMPQNTPTGNATPTSTSAKPKLKLRINSKKTASTKSTSKKMTPTTKSPKRSPVPTMQSSSSLPPDKGTTPPPAAATAATTTASDNNTKNDNNNSGGTTTTTATTAATAVATSNTTKTTKSKKPTSTPKSTPSAPSRGKELPSAIAAAKANAKKESSSNAKKESNSNNVSPLTVASTPSAKTTSTKSSTTKKESRKTNRTPKAKSSAMTPKYKAQCCKVLSALKQREENVSWFIKSVKSQFKASIMTDYTQKVPHPMDIGTMTNKLEKNSYASVADFAQDLRRIYGNCSRYNVVLSDPVPRQVAREMLTSSEQYLHLFLVKNLNSSSSSSKAFPKLLYCWKTCLEILDEVVGLQNSDDKQQTAYYFLHPASFFFKGKLPQDYTDKVKNPMDFGTITSNLIEGVYQTVEAFVKDCKLVTSNCKAYHEDPGAVFVIQANRLEEFLLPKLDDLLQYDKSSKGAEGRKMASSPAALTLLKPPNTFYTSMLDELRSADYKDKSTKLTEKATLQFEHSVDISSFKDYLEIVETPMDLQTVETNITNGVYQYPEDFEYDVNLIFKNCEAYNVPKQNIHIVNLSKHCARIFRKMYALRIKAYEASGGKALYGDEKKAKRRSSDISVTSAPPTKKLKTESNNAKRKSPMPQVTNNQSIARAKSPKNQGKKTVPRLVIHTNGPVPLHVAIAKIKQSFTRRRQHKELQDWEGACSRFFREFKKHPWASSSKRFVFDAPVPMLHPEIKVAYKDKIKNPMDLTTAEGKLLQGGIYKEAQEFIDDVALVFANAVTFNKSGHEQGDPTSCAYFDASKHLLRYTRWLSLEYLSAYLADDSHSEGIRQSGPLKHWKLTKSNQNDARFEMENIVLQQNIDRSDEGDRFTWQETECEKLLRSLRHQTDHKRMAYFIRPNFPPDYVGIISKPICWEDCCKKLQQRKYETFGDVISDLRLIFTNALKYNGRVKHLDPTSQQAYDSAVIMAGKLEAAIQRLYVTVADRIEREKVEEVILDREAEDQQKAEEERLRTELQKERERTRRNGNQSMPSSSIQSVKIIQRRAARRDLDFDNPFDQDNSFEQSEMETQNKQKRMYEQQQRDRVDMHRVCRNVGIRVFHNLFWRSQATYWAKDMSFQIQQNLSQNRTLQSGAEKIEKEKQSEIMPKPSLVSSLLGTSSRSQVKMNLAKKPKQNKKKRKRLFLDL